jgi:hypothetical protein
LDTTRLDDKDKGSRLAWRVHQRNGGQEISNVRQKSRQQQQRKHGRVQNVGDFTCPDVCSLMFFLFNFLFLFKKTVHRNGERKKKNERRKERKRKEGKERNKKKKDG